MDDNIHEVRLSSDEFDCLKEALAVDEIFWRRLASGGLCRDGQFILAINLESSERIRERLAEKLAESGFENDYLLTSQGKVWENLIDRFYIPSA